MLNSSSAATPISAAFSSASCLMNLQATGILRPMWVLRIGAHQHAGKQQGGDRTYR